MADHIRQSERNVAPQAGRAARWLAAVAVTVSLAAVSPRVASAQSLWDYSPYRVRVWVALSPRATEQARWTGQLESALLARCRNVFGAGCRIDMAPPPEALWHDVARRPEMLTLQRIGEHDEAVLADDKLILLSVARLGGDYRLTSRELDCQTRTWLPVRRRRCRQEAALAESAMHAVLDAFTPLAVVDRARGNQATLRLRAGMLATDDDSPVLVEPGEVMQPILRRNDRLGNPQAGGVQPVAWTLATVEQRNQSALECEVISGYRNPLGSRGSRRVQRLALAVRPAYAETELTLQTRGETSAPLAGYDVYARRPDEQQSQWVGRSDAAGVVRVSRADQLWTVLFVTSGQRRLARLPMVPGAAPQWIVRLDDDRLRLAAEGTVTGLDEQLVDLVALRHVLAARIRRKIEKKALDDAESLHRQFITLDGRDAFIRKLRDRQQQAVRQSDPQQREHFAAMYAHTLRMANQYLGSELGEQLGAELKQARQIP